MNLLAKNCYFHIESTNKFGSVLVRNILKNSFVINFRQNFNSRNLNCLKPSGSHAKNYRFNLFQLSKYLHDSTIKKSDVSSTETEQKAESLFVRFKRTYKQHGKIFIGVHVVTSIFWAGSVYAIAYNGFELEPILKWLNIGESYIEKLNKPGVGVAAAAYLMYKLISPLRYAVTIGGTQFVVRYMKQKGKMPEVPEANKIRSLIKEGRVQVNDSYRRRRRKRFSRNNGQSNS